MSMIRETLSLRWSDLSDEVRAWALATGRARLADVSVALGDVEAWRDDWRSEGASWPTYTLDVSVDGQEVGSVVGWHVIGEMGPDGNRREREWACQDDDGCYSGKCTACIDDDPEPAIESGSNVGKTLLLPQFAADGAVLVYDQDTIQVAIDDAASEADHGDDPSLADLDPDDGGEDYETRYVVRDFRIVEITIRKCQKFPNGEESDCYRNGHYRSTVTTYLLTGYAVVDGDTTCDVCETVDEAIAEADVTGDDGELHATEQAAQTALAALVDDRLDDLDDLDGMTHDRDDDGLYVAPDDADDDDTDARYHLDAEETVRVCLHGWYAVLDEIVGALGRRAALDASRSWQADMDRVIADRDPWVMLSDSIAGGNCATMSRAFAATFGARIGAAGEVGAARASAILAIRDDTFSRRACRMAAHRAMQTA